MLAHFNTRACSAKELLVVETEAKLARQTLMSHKLSHRPLKDWLKDLLSEKGFD
jgi:hypothetical protein